MPPGYDCAVSIPPARLAQKAIRDGRAVCQQRVFHAGRLVHEAQHHIEIRGGTAVGLPVFRWPDHDAEWNGNAGFLELSFHAEDGRAMFRDTRVVGFYAIYSKPGKKSFFSDNAFRYGAPPTINQIAAFGRYVDAYPVMHLDRARDLGETLTLINPYAKAVLASVATQDGRQISRRRVAPMSVLNLSLAELLKPGEERWLGHLQLTATNRLVTFHIKHSMADPRVISDHEHLDAFRGDKTHYPLTQLIRLRVGEFLRNRGLLRA
ncbi:MAG: hypothetical protein FJX36_11220 [Alphaproteobacteria bacterium]|nr:hypothetical protein [Alphaproteobacteria bacterium]